jgi:hypothetical protein
MAIPYATANTTRSFCGQVVLSVRWSVMISTIRRLMSADMLRTIQHLEGVSQMSAISAEAIGVCAGG